MLNRLLKDRSLWEHPLLDLWTIPHVLSGALLAYALVWLGVDLWVGLGLSIAAAIAWEVFEKIAHLSDVERHPNGMSDIIAAQVGYVAGVWLFNTYAGTGVDTIAAAAAAVIFIILSLLGWLSHRWYGK